MWLFGKPYSGLTALCREVSRELGIVHLKSKDILNHFLKNPFDVQAKKLRSSLRKGEKVDDDLIVDLIYKRLQFPDVVENGYILQGFPTTCDQVRKLNAKGVIPMLTFSNLQTDLAIKSRALKSRQAGSSTFKLDPEILNTRIKETTEQFPLIERFLLHHYNNLRYVSSALSIESNLVKIRTDLSDVLRQRYNVAQELTEGRPFNSRCIMLQKKEV